MQIYWMDRKKLIWVFKKIILCIPLLVYTDSLKLVQGNIIQNCLILIHINWLHKERQYFCHCFTLFLSLFHGRNVIHFFNCYSRMFFHIFNVIHFFSIFSNASEIRYLLNCHRLVLQLLICMHQKLNWYSSAFDFLKLEDFNK